MKAKNGNEIIKSKKVGCRVYEIPKSNSGTFGDMFIEVSNSLLFVGVDNKKSKRRRELLFAWSEKGDNGALYYIEKSAGDNTSISIDSSGINSYIGAPLEVHSVVRHELGIISDKFSQRIKEPGMSKKVAVSIVQHPRVTSLVNEVISTMSQKDPSIMENLKKSKTYQILVKFMCDEEVDDFTPEYIEGLFTYHEIARSDCDLPSEKETGKGQYIKK